MRPRRFGQAISVSPAGLPPYALSVPSPDTMKPRPETWIRLTSLFGVGAVELFEQWITPS